MKRAVTLPWSAASWRARTYSPRVETVRDPIGVRMDTESATVDGECICNRNRVFFAPGEVSTCQRCGYHVCSCAESGALAKAAGDVADQWMRAMVGIGRQYAEVTTARDVKAGEMVYVGRTPDLSMMLTPRSR